MLKYCAAFLAIILCGNASSSDISAKLNELDLEGEIEPFAMEGTINQTLQELREKLPDPLDIELTIPQLNFADALMNGTLDLSNPSIIGLTTFLVPALKFNIIGFKLNLTLLFPVFQVDPTYETDMILLTVLPIYGNGTAKVYLNDLKLDTYLELKTSPSLHIQNFRILITLDNIKLDIEGLLYDEEFSKFASAVASGLANTFITPYINDNAEAISDVLSPIIETAINEILAGNSSTSAPVTEPTPAAEVTIKELHHLIQNALPSIF
ncbi:uncharacterized protein LOC660043 [Tribolium castaneum]|uniref:Protein takeout-like Protein n=1 Tax=Tribolium castaneum TaxID=7070 RepID=D6WL22_TRICA|nr:PREDICTED: uncharacterized protein LOC660043 [Tribolium castaneum]EFA03523.1 hypothetical protein TcasGA2_TC013525 [Tribolium castaneum]|eukprot:XP_976334.1 PREDICTED: uncharacterized protein LOC660043 [Tribolium castaneum]